MQMEIKIHSYTGCGQRRVTITSSVIWVYKLQRNTLHDTEDYLPYIVHRWSVLSTDRYHDTKSHTFHHGLSVPVPGSRYPLFCIHLLCIIRNRNVKTPLGSDTDRGALFFIPGLVSPAHVVESSAGGTVTINCLEGCAESVTTGITTLIIWWKTNNSHILQFVTTLKPNQISSNFSEPRYSFQDPTNLQITDAQPSDSGNYSCEVSTSIGVCKKTFPLHVSGKFGIDCIQLNTVIIYHCIYYRKHKNLLFHFIKG